MLNVLIHPLKRVRVSGADLCTLVQKHRPSRQARQGDYEVVDEVSYFLTVATVKKQHPSSVNTAYCHLLPGEKA